jgi:hypothetical protein
MLSRLERILLNVLLWVFLAAGGSVLFLSQIQRSRELAGKAVLLRNQLQHLATSPGDITELEPRKQQLQSALEAMRKKYFEPGEMDPYRFALLVRNLLVSNHLAINRYQTLDTGQRTLLEFSVAGDSLDFVQFLQQVSGAEKYWSVPFLSLSATDGRVQSVFRITYEISPEVAR